MPTNVSLIKSAMTVLMNLDGNPLADDALGQEIELTHGRPLTTQEINGILSFCMNKEWVNTRRDTFRRKVWWITDHGRAAYKDL